MKVLFFSKYGRLAASTRYRHEQFLPFLKTQGIEAAISPLLSDDYLKEKFRTGRSSLRHLVGALFRRIAALARAKKYDLVVVHCELFPYLPPIFEWYLRIRRIPYVYDFDDAIFHQYDLHRSGLVRRLLGDKIARVIRGAAGVLAGNSYLADYARRYNSNVHIFPTVVDTVRYKAGVHTPGARPFTIGWIGSPSTAKYVREKEVALQRFCARHAAEVVLVGSGPFTLSDVPLSVRDWSEEAEVLELQRFDVGIMPLTDDPWARGKCGFKLIQYMAAKVAVIASPVGVNADLVTPGQEGYLATTDTEWEKALEALISDPQGRLAMGERGSAKVAREYSVQAQAPRLAKFIKSTQAHP